MRWLPIAASFVFALSPARDARASSHHHKAAADQASKGSHASHSRLGSRTSRHALFETRESRPHASLRNARYSPADTPQSTSSTSHVSGKSKKKPSKKKRTAAHRRPSQMAPTPDRISDIQSALARGGYYKGESNGKMDPDTVDAVQRFQAANGLDTTGKLDALTLQKLGLGSDIAGVSSPKGIVPHSCCSMSPSPSLAPKPAPSQSSPTPSTTPAAPKPSASLDAGTSAQGLPDSAPATSSH
jgi:peptidoglycan hydrolase-like protein with peptidoglycan-binding domain